MVEKRSNNPILDNSVFQNNIKKMNEAPLSNTGFSNLGNNNFFNAFLQALFHCETFRMFMFQKWNKNKYTKSRTINETITLIKKYWSGKYSVINPKHLLDAIAFDSEIFDPNDAKFTNVQIIFDLFILILNEQTSLIKFEKISSMKRLNKKLLFLENLFFQMLNSAEKNSNQYYREYSKLLFDGNFANVDEKTTKQHFLKKIEELKISIELKIKELRKDIEILKKNKLLPNNKNLKKLKIQNNKDINETLGNSKTESNGPSVDKILDKLFKPTKETHKSIIKDLFYAKAFVKTECGTCGKGSETDTLIRGISLDDPPVAENRWFSGIFDSSKPSKLGDCLERFFDQSWKKEKSYCHTCKMKIHSLKKVYLKDYPEVLALSFRPKPVNYSSKRAPITFPITNLDLSNYAFNESLSELVSSSKDTSIEEISDELNSNSISDQNSKKNDKNVSECSNGIEKTHLVEGSNIIESSSGLDSSNIIESSNSNSNESKISSSSSNSNSKSNSNSNSKSNSNSNESKNLNELQSIKTKKETDNLKETKCSFKDKDKDKNVEKIEKSPEKRVKKIIKKNTKYIYSLKALIKFEEAYGCLASVAYCKNPVTGRWKKFNDRNVEDVEESAIFSPKGLNVEMLFYERDYCPNKIVTDEVKRIIESSNSLSKNQKKILISTQWLMKAAILSSPGPLENRELLCSHGYINRTKDKRKKISVPVSKEDWEWLNNHFGNESGKLYEHYKQQKCDKCEDLKIKYRQKSEFDVVTKLEKEYEIDKEKVTYIVSEPWMANWRRFVTGDSACAPEEIDNYHLLDETGKINMDLKMEKDFRVISDEVWNYLKRVYGGGPEIINDFLSEKDL